jgi:hypothetical protein
MRAAARFVADGATRADKKKAAAPFDAAANFFENP